MSFARIAGLFTALTLGVAAHAQLVIVNNQPGTFMNIGPIIDGGDGTGIPLNLSSANPIALQPVLTISNAVLAINPGDQVVIHNNGGISFNNPIPANHILSNLNLPLPSNSAFNGRPAFIPLWDDIDTVGDVFFREISNNRLIVQWNRKGFEDAPEEEETTFQVQIFDDNSLRGLEVYAQYLYADVEGIRAASGASATIGFQNGGGAFNDFQWSFNMPAVFDDDVLSLIPEPATLALLILGAGAVLRSRRG